MNRFTTGMIAGGIIGALGLGYALSDKRTRRKLTRDGQKMMRKAGHMMDKIEDMI